MNIPDDLADKVKKELQQLDETPVRVDGKELKPSSCYYFGNNPLHVLYNTNCPGTLKEQIESILSKHIPGNESSTR